MIIFRSSLIENVDYAVENGIWQVQYNPSKVEIGKKVVICVTKTKFVFLLGEVTSNVHLAPVADWPISGPLQAFKEAYTIRTKRIIPQGQWKYTEI